MRRSQRGAVFRLEAANEAREWRRIQPGLATGDALGDVASVRMAEAYRLREQADARLTDRVRRRGFGSGANFALPWAVDCVKRQQFRTWKGGRVV
jgi:predicted esterase